MPTNLRTIFENDTKLDALWFIDTEKNNFMWVLSNSFFYLPPEKQVETIEKLKYAANVYCERCDKLQRPFREETPYEPTPIDPTTGFSIYGCLHFSAEECARVNEILKADRISRTSKGWFSYVHTAIKRILKRQ